MSSGAVRGALPYLAIALLAAAVREALVLRSGGVFATYGYDTAVYYASADALIHGRLPYLDFVLLHPPTIMLALTPTALLGHLTSDHIGFVAASISFTLLSGADAALVALTARRWALPRAAALLAGIFYAVWFGAASAEYSCRLEPLGNFFLLAALFALGPQAKESGSRSDRAFVIAGLALGLAASTKIWFAVPALVIVGWLVAGRRMREVGRVGIGFAAAVAVIDLPFLVLSRGAMFARVVVDQLSRPAGTTPARGRLSTLTSVSHLPAGKHSPLLLVAVILLCVAVVAIAACKPAPSLFPLLAAAHGVVLLLSPSWFGFYADFLAVPFALSLAGAASVSTRLRFGRLPLGRGLAVAAVAIAALSTGAVLESGSFHATEPWRRPAALVAAVQQDRCVMSDMPAGLIELNKLDSDLSHGCPNWIDVTGRTYFGRDRANVRRAANRPWQKDLLDYLTEGQAALVERPAGDGLSAADQAALTRRGVIARRPGQVLYATKDND